MILSCSCYNHSDPLSSIHPIQPHHDTEKADGMFGTMVVQLPSDYDGGVLRVCHHGKEMTFDFSGLKGMTGFHYAAFYADCQHELCKVTRGYRMCLVYNLVYSGGGTCPVPIDNHQIVTGNKVVAGIQDWEQDDNGLPVVAYMLNHQYCKASLSFKLLKNADRAIAEVLLEANKQKGFYLYLGTVTLHQIYSGEGDDTYIYDYFKANSLVSPSGATLDSSIHLDKNAIVPDDVFDKTKPDDEKLQASGNEGIQLDKTYHQAALLMWPKKHRVIVMGVDALISELESSCKMLATPGCEPDAQQQQECEVIAKEIIVASKNSLRWLTTNAAVRLLACQSVASKNSLRWLTTNAAVRLLACLRQLKAASLTSELLQAIPVDRASCLSCQSFSEAVVKSCIAFGWEQLEPALVAFFRSFASENVEESCTFLSVFADVSVSSQQIKVCQKLVDIICHVLTSEKDIAAPSVHQYCRYHSTRPCSRPMKFVCQLFKIFSVMQCEEQLKIVIQSFFKQPNRYPLSTTLVPAAIELHQCMYEGTHAPLYSLLSHCVTTLQHSTQEAPTWSNNSDLKCSCELCAELTAFLKDPTRKVARMKRAHLEHQLTHCSDVTCKVGTPAINCFVQRSHEDLQTIVVTKYQQSYDAKMRNYQSQLALLQQVHPLLEQLEKPSKCLKVDDNSQPMIEH